jgi:Tripartite tricarboxylate transporter family receptor
MRVLALLAALVLGLAPAQAQQYPDWVIKLVVPFVPGSPVDVLGRVVSQQMTTRLGQGVVVENRPGAGTSTATKQVQSSPADGYTLLMMGQNLVYVGLLLPRHRLRPGEVVRAGRHAGRLVACDADRQQRAGEVGHGTGRVRQGQSRQGHLRLRARHVAADRRQIVRARGRPRSHQRALQRRRAGARRSSRRAHPHQFCAGIECPPDDPGRQGPRAGGDELGARPGAAGRSDLQGERLSGRGLRSRRMAGDRGAARHAGSGRQQAQCRDQCSVALGRGAGDLQEAALPADDPFPRAVWPIPARAGRTLAADHQRGGAEGATAAASLTSPRSPRPGSRASRGGRAAVPDRIPSSSRPAATRCA